MMKRNWQAALLCVMAGCATPGERRADTGPAPFFEGMGEHRRPVSTTSETAQRYFDQGLVWAYAFNHDEAIRSFREATRLDPNCAMAWWGISLCNGPHINNPAMDEKHSQDAYEALQKALSHKLAATPTERELIDALSKRYADSPPADRKPLDEAYAAAMREVWKRHPGDTDVGALFAEAMMDLRPWDLWTKEGKPHPGTEEVVATLEQVLRLNPKHPMGIHLYIHAVEASPLVERAVGPADRLRDLVPAAGHLVHMPGHIDIRVGQWTQAATANEKAIETDRKYRKISPRQGFYHIYMAHNHHFLAFTAMMEGRSAVALRAARDMIAGVPEEYAKANPAIVDGYMPIVLEVMMRFGKWDEILKEPAPPRFLPISSAFWRFTRGVAYAAKGQTEQAEKEQARFRDAVAKVPADAVVSINPAKDVLAIAGHVLTAEIAFRRGQVDTAVAELEQAIKIEDQLKYMEPPDWIQPVRHTLGAFLVHAGRHADAEKVYRQDLKYWPENAWSLYGLTQCLKARGAADAAEVESRFRKAWSRADIQIGSTCLCVNGAG